MCISSVWAPETVGATKWGAGLCDASVQALAFPARGLGRAPPPAGPQAPSLSTEQGSIFSGKRWGVSESKELFRPDVSWVTRDPDGRVCTFRGLLCS